LVARAEHFGEHGSRSELGGVDLFGTRNGGGFGLEGDAEEAVVPVDVDVGIVGPDGVAGMIGGVLFADDTVDTAKTIDQEIVRPAVLYVFGNRLADALENGVLGRIEGRSQALGGVEDDARRIAGAVGGDSGVGLERKRPVGAEAVVVA
jgi:hypothetical protein